jgi:hypothetical protein
MTNFRVGERVFNSFNEIVDFAWNEFKIDIWDYPISESEKQEACVALEDLIKED